MDIYLCFSGSFSPIHNGHIKVIDIIIEKLTNFNVVKTFIAPSSESYVNKNLGTDALNFKDRCELVNIIIKFRQNIELCDYGLMSCGKTIYELKRNKKIPYNAKVFEICGIDYVLRRQA